jgi:diguanylate cyclase
MMKLSALAAPDEEFTDALRRARAAINLLADLQVAPTPLRFAVAYAHQLGEISDLSLAMNRLISHDHLTAAAVDELYQQFFGDQVDRFDLNFASQKVEDTVSDVTDQLGATRRHSESYAGQLQDFIAALAAGEIAGLREHAALLMAATESAAREQRQLEDRLSFSLRELETLRRQLDRLERELRRDPLTGIGNRATFNRELRSFIARAKREDEPLSLLMIDIDFFKRFNDDHGHHMGDQVLKLVARQLIAVASAGSEPARYGGEEFALMLRRHDPAQAITLARRVGKLVAGKKVVNRRTGQTLGQVTLSIGVAHYRPGETAAELVDRAIDAMYLAKAAGRNCVIGDDHPGILV